MRRSVLVLDTDAPAHAVSDGVHGFLAQDGTPPVELRATGRKQLKPYRSVEVRGVAARLAHSEDDGFELGLGDGTRVRAARLLLAHGMRYELPDLDGITEVWGKRAFHCPYCHGWEVRDQRVAVYGCSDRAVHQARIDEHEGALRVGFAGGDGISTDALFVQPRLELTSNLAAELGAELTAAGTAVTDDAGLSTVAGLYVAGDAATPVQSVAVATASGARAAYAINADLAIPPDASA
jgi:thioredoxin reductase